MSTRQNNTITAAWAGDIEEIAHCWTQAERTAERALLADAIAGGTSEDAVSRRTEQTPADLLAFLAVHNTADLLASLL